jgi:hypothetical protein
LQRLENPGNGLPDKTLKIDGQVRAAFYKIYTQISGFLLLWKAGARSLTI